jgi:predicted short-subunit dehydrogenase-like oxidoreductase (DUF2520 family)
MGQGLGLAFGRAGYSVVLLSRSHRTLQLPLSVEVEDWAGRLQEAEVVLIATPDEAIPAVAARLSGEAAIGPDHAVFHVSGWLDHDAIDALEPSKAALGSFHPLQAIASPVSAPERLRGAYVGIEGDPRAVRVGKRMAHDLGLTPVEIPLGAKTGYHAGATIVASYTVALMALATRVVERAGIPPELAGRLYVPLLRGVTANLAEVDPVDALTGPIMRGDVETVAAHLAVLAEEERELYRALGRFSLELARTKGLDEAVVTELALVLAEPEGDG